MNDMERTTKKSRTAFRAWTPFVLVAGAGCRQMSEHVKDPSAGMNGGGRSTSSRYRIEIKRYGSNDLGIDGDSLWAYHAEALRAALGEMKTSMAAYLAQAR